MLVPMNVGEANRAAFIKIWMKEFTYLQCGFYVLNQPAVSKLQHKKHLDLDVTKLQYAAVVFYCR